MSFPGPPLRTSLPPWPSMVSLPPSPQSTSRCGVPTRTSTPGVPVTVQAVLTGAACPRATANSATMANSAAIVFIRFSRSGLTGAGFIGTLGHGGIPRSGDSPSEGLFRPGGDAHVRLAVAAFLAERDLTCPVLPRPRDLGVVPLELVEEDLEAGALELLLELLVRFLDVAVEVALDDLGRALGALLRVRELVLFDLGEARRQLRRV